MLISGQQQQNDSLYSSSVYRRPASTFGTATLVVAPSLATEAGGDGSESPPHPHHLQLSLLAPADSAEA